jgi:hypothetical protein
METEGQIQNSQNEIFQSFLNEDQIFSSIESQDNQNITPPTNSDSIKLNNNLIFTNATNAEEESKNQSSHFFSHSLNPRYVRWTPNEDKKLIEIVMNEGSRNWDKISENFTNKSKRQIIYRWYKILRSSAKDKTSWTEQEDTLLLTYVKNKVRKNWEACAKLIGTSRSAKSCKERWYNVLSIQHDPESFTAKDELRLLLLVSKLGTKWSFLVQFFNNKNENQLKNRCYSILKKTATEITQSTDSNKNLQLNSMNSLEILKFLPNTILNYKNLLGKETFEMIYVQVYNSLSNANTSESTRKSSCCETNLNQRIHCVTSGENKTLVINVCLTCKTKLKEHLKKKLIAKFLNNKLNEINSFTNGGNNNSCIKNLNLPYLGNGCNLESNTQVINNNYPANSNNQVDVDILKNKFTSASNKIEALKDILSNLTQNLSL